MAGLQGLPAMGGVLGLLACRPPMEATEHILGTQPPLSDADVNKWKCINFPDVAQMKH